MKITKISFVAVCIFCTSFISLRAQEKSKKVLNDLTTLIEVSNSYENYKVVEKKGINAFEATLKDYIQNEQNVQALLREEVKKNENTILGLQNQIDEYKNSNDALLNEKASIGFLGFSIGKKKFTVIMWTLFLGALLAALILFFKFKSANKITTHSKSVLKDLEEEYESYRRVCIEREQGLRRQLFEEAKKFKELKNVS